MLLNNIFSFTPAQPPVSFKKYIVFSWICLDFCRYRWHNPRVGDSFNRFYKKRHFHIMFVGQCYNNFGKYLLFIVYITIIKGHGQFVLKNKFLQLRINYLRVGFIAMNENSLKVQKGKTISFGIHSQIQ